MYKYNIFILLYLGISITAIARVHRQISEDNTSQLSTDNPTGLTTQLQVSTSQVHAYTLILACS